MVICLFLTDHVPSRAYLLLLDVLVASLQLIYLVIAYDQTPRIETSTVGTEAAESSSDDSDSDDDLGMSCTAFYTKTKLRLQKANPSMVPHHLPRPISQILIPVQ